MPFSVGSSVNDFSDWLYDNERLRDLVSNPITSALFMAFMIVLILFLMYLTVGEAVRAGFWIFIVLIGALCIHDKILTLEIRGQKSKKGGHDLTSKYDIVSRDKSVGSSHLYPSVPVVGDAS